MAKFCINCGKQLKDDAAFCKYCGTNQSAKIGTLKINADIPDLQNEMADADDSYFEESPKGNGSKKAVVIIALIIIAVLIASAVAIFVFLGKEKNNESSSSTAVAEESTTEDEKTEATSEEKTEAAEENSKEEESAKESEKDEDESDDSYYKVGEVYTVQTNLRVREGPGKKYRILDRSELVGDDWAQSVDSKETTDALLEKGSKVTCLEMSGKWMRIESGWICTEDGGEVLIK